MYVVVEQHKSKAAISDLIAHLAIIFPNERFSLFGSDDTVFQCRIEGIGDEKMPRAYAQIFLKKWVPREIG
jgi:hypothetical protein